jgi:hypothetical protein
MPVSTTQLSTRTDKLISVALVVLVIMGVSPLFDMLVLRTPMRFGEAPWRYQTFLMLLSNGPQLLILLALLLALATFAGKRSVVRGVAVAAFVIAVVYLIVLPLFGLDFLTIRRLVAQAAKRSVDMMALKTMIYGGIVVLLAAWIGSLAWGASARSEEAARREQGHGLVVGQTE